MDIVWTRTTPPDGIKAQPWVTPWHVWGKDPNDDWRDPTKFWLNRIPGYCARVPDDDVLVWSPESIPAGVEGDAWHAAHLSAVRQYHSGPISLYSRVPVRAEWNLGVQPWPAHAGLLRANRESWRRLGPLVDRIGPDLYRAEKSLSTWLRFADRQLRICRDLTDKPIDAWMMLRYHPACSKKGQAIDPDELDVMFRAVLARLSPGDRIIIWPEPDDPTAEALAALRAIAGEGRP